MSGAFWFATGMIFCMFLLALGKITERFLSKRKLNKDFQKFQELRCDDMIKSQQELNIRLHQNWN